MSVARNFFQPRFQSFEKSSPCKASFPLLLSYSLLLQTFWSWASYFYNVLFYNKKRDDIIFFFSLKYFPHIFSCLFFIHGVLHLMRLQTSLWKWTDFIFIYLWRFLSLFSLWYCHYSSQLIPKLMFKGRIQKNNLFFVNFVCQRI